jgi:hypothetical protein
MDIKKTQALDELIADVEISEDPFSLFAHCHIKEVRQACLKKMFRVFMVNEERAIWAKECIIALLQKEDSMAIEVLRWFIVRDSSIDPRSINFMLSNIVPKELYEKPGNERYISWNEASKLLLKQSYYRPIQLHSIDSVFFRFFSDVADEIINDGRGLLGYGDEIWEILERLLKVSIKGTARRVQVRSDKQTIELLVELLRKEKIKPFNDENGFKKAQHLAILNRTLALISSK